MPNSQTSGPSYSQIATVVLDVALEKALDYGIPSSLQEKITVGMRVQVPVKTRIEKALVIEIKQQSTFSKLQPIYEIISQDSVLSPDLLSLAQFLSSYYATPIRKVFHSILPSSLRSDQKEKVQFFIKRAISEKKIEILCQTFRRSTPMQAKILDILLQNPKGLFLTELLQQSQTSQAPVQALVEKKILQMQLIQIDRSIIEEEEFFQTVPKTLYDSQKYALEQITDNLARQCYQTFLLHGITGSGKTEVYLQAIEYARKQNRSVIFLVPEIALTSQTIERLKSRFLEPIAILHHRLSNGQRLDTWKAIQKGKLQIVVGARSAIFSPLSNLGLIIIDEEHDNSYKQNEEMPCYHARDVAVIRGNITGATVILGSATPSFESYYNAQIQKYTLIRLSTRAQNASLPKVHIVDMNLEYAKAKGFTIFSDAMLRSIKKRLEVGEQTLLFLNRRGYHTSQVCCNCRKVMGCPHCDISLTFHRGECILSCHLCGYLLTPPPSSCPHCKSSHTMKFRGIGTEAVEKTLYALLPEVRILRMDADTTKHKGSHDRLFKQFRSGKADILIGTQMIAKGLHFPSVTLVGILNTDSGLHIPDFRSSESTFQLICQVAGRSGRSFLPGEVIIQTTIPNHFVIQLAAKEDFEAFFLQESETRKIFNFPPFTSLVRIVFSGKSEAKTLQTAQKMHQQLVKKLPSAYILHPVIPCCYGKIKDHYRFHFLIKGRPISYLTAMLMESVSKNPKENGVGIVIDIDAVSTFF